MREFKPRHCAGYLNMKLTFIAHPIHVYTESRLETTSSEFTLTRYTLVLGITDDLKEASYNWLNLSFSPPCCGHSRATSA